MGKPLPSDAAPHNRVVYGKRSRVCRQASRMEMTPGLLVQGREFRLRTPHAHAAAGSRRGWAGQAALGEKKRMISRAGPNLEDSIMRCHVKSSCVDMRRGLRPFFPRYLASQPVHHVRTGPKDRKAGANERT